MIVVDASAVVELLLGTAVGARVGRRVADVETETSAPSLIDIEVINALRGLVHSGNIEEQRALKAIEHLLDLAVSRWPHETLLPRIWQLRHNLTAYDAAYVALADGLGATLLTTDRSIAAAPGIECEIEVID